MQRPQALCILGIGGYIAVFPTLAAASLPSLYSMLKLESSFHLQSCVKSRLRMGRTISHTRTWLVQTAAAGVFRRLVGVNWDNGRRDREL